MTRDVACDVALISAFADDVANLVADTTVLVFSSNVSSNVTIRCVLARKTCWTS